MTLESAAIPLLDADLYYSGKAAQLESARLWPRVWLMACREQEVAKPGDYVVFDIDGESIVIVRTSPAEIRAFYNVCQHRGRRLLEGRGNTGTTIACRFHGWGWKTDGTIRHITDREDYAGVPGFCDAALALKPVKLDTWAGWVWVSMDPDIVPLRQYLAPVPEFLDPFELEDTRITWYKTLVFPCNWKTIAHAFNEAYHVAATHSQVLRFGAPKSASFAYGNHSHFFYPPPKPGAPTAPVRTFADLREQVRTREHERDKLLHALISPYSLRAVDRLTKEAPSDLSPSELIAKYRLLHREEMEAAGAKWPSRLTEAQIAKAGVDWHIFPNSIVLPCIDGAQWYRTRPNGNDPESCIFEIWWMERYGAGKEPDINPEVFPTLESFRGQNHFLEQDFSNLIAVQKGIRSRGFAGLLPNPVQEIAISNFHRALEEYLAHES